MRRRGGGPKLSIPQLINRLKDEIRHQKMEFKGTKGSVESELNRAEKLLDRMQTDSFNKATGNGQSLGAQVRKALQGESATPGSLNASALMDFDSQLPFSLNPSVMQQDPFNLNRQPFLDRYVLTNTEAGSGGRQTKANTIPAYGRRKFHSFASQTHPMISHSIKGCGLIRNLGIRPDHFCTNKPSPLYRSNPSAGVVMGFTGLSWPAVSRLRLSSIAPGAVECSRFFMSSSAGGKTVVPIRKQTSAALNQSASRSLSTESEVPKYDDRLTRWPEASAGGLLRLGDYFGTAIFAMTGTLTAAGTGMDLLGCTIVGTITAVGGGTIRDFLLGHENGHSKRAFWMDEPEYLFICLGTAALTFLFWNDAAKALGLSEEDTWIFWGDSVGIGVFCCIGAMNGVRAGVHPLIAAICGMVTSTFGGLTRDVLCRRPVRILHSNAEIYATTAFCGSAAYLAVRSVGASLAIRALSGFTTAIVMRTAAWQYDIKLPVKDQIYHHPKANKGRIE